MSKVYLITGANTGLGEETTRQLAALDDTSKIYLACRSEGKAKACIERLTKVGVNASKLEFVKFDADDSKDDIAKIVSSIKEPLTSILLNAGGFGPDSKGKPTEPNGVPLIYQMNLIGHIQLVDVLLKANKIKKASDGGRIIYGGSEAARGLFVLTMTSGPKMGETKEWYEARIKEGAAHGKSFKAWHEYGYVKGMAALYFASWASKNTDYYVLTVSPGMTMGTAAASAPGVPAHFRHMMPVMGPMMLMTHQAHKVSVGAGRYVRAMTGAEEYADFKSGTFVASKSLATGKVCDQAEVKSAMFKQYGDKTKQDACFKALVAYSA